MLRLIHNQGGMNMGKKDHWVFLLGLVAAMLLFGVAATAETGELQPCISTEGKFSILLPGGPQVSSQVITMASGRTTAVTTFILETDNGNCVYFVSYNDYSPADANGLDQDILALARDGAVANVSGTLASDQPITLKGFPGRAFAGTTANGLAFDEHIYLVGHRLYQVLIVTDKNKVCPYRDAVMNSFSIK
jgi:hypothetical protein